MAGATQQTDAVEAGAVEGDGLGVDEVVGALMTAEFRQDPYRLYARMRREHPVHRSDQGNWYLTRYADVDQAVGNVCLSNDRDRMTEALAARHGQMRSMSRLVRRLGRVMSNTDPPEHTRLRRLAGKAFTVRQVENLRGRVQDNVDELLDAAVTAGSTMDLTASLASPLPSSVIGDLARRRARPADDFVSALIAAQDGGDGLSDDELLSTCFMLLTAGFETTTNLIGNAVLALLRHPDQLRRLQKDPTQIRSAVQELLRYDTPSQMTIRVVAQATQIGGQALGAGDLVYLVLAATNRDPDRFADPDRLDLGRGDIRDLSFAAGPHFCLGAPLARLEAEIAIGTLVRRLPALRLDTETVQWRPNPLQRGPISLPVAY